MERGPRVNRQIRAREVLVISASREQIGVFPAAEALRMAEEMGLDLVEVAADARPPVCRILDYGKYKYEQKKKARGSSKKGHTTKLKGMRLKPATGEHDLEVKARRARGFIEAGDKVQFTVIFRGRQLARQDLGHDLLNRVVGLLEDVAKIEKPPHMEGNRMHMILVRK
ncbi:MAG: translation initiation factor IF-3 [Planctomycetota bacterium]